MGRHPRRRQSAQDVALNADNGTVTSFDPNPNGEVAAIVVSGSTVYAGGFFTSIGGLPRNKIAALNPDDRTVTPWNPDATANANVLALAVSGSTVYAGGNFTSIGGQPRQNIAAINAGDGTPTPFSANANDGVFALAVSDSTVYAGGFFTTISGQPRSTLAALTTEGIVTRRYRRLRAGGSARRDAARQWVLQGFRPRCSTGIRFVQPSAALTERFVASGVSE